MQEERASKASILIIEDNESLRTILKLVFERKGFETEQVVTGREGLEKAQGRFFNVVILDIKLPDMDGTDLVKPLKEIHPDMELIVTTGHASLDTAVKALNEGASAYVTKPLDMEDILGRVREFVGKQHLLFENRRLYQEAQQEIEKRKRVEEEIQASKRLLETVFDTIPHTMVIKDKECRYINVNNAWYEFRGLSPGEVLNKTSMEILGMPEEDRINILKDDQITLSGEEEVRIFEHTRFNRYGEKRSFQNIRSKIRDEKDNVVGIVAIAQDITERMALEAQFQQAQKMEAVGTLAGGIAHNFNNLLQMIMGNISLLLMETDSSHPQYEILSAIKDRVKSGAELTKQLLGFARGGKYQVKPTDLNKILAAVSKMFARTHTEITIQRKYGKHLSTTNVDQGQIEQVLLNMLVNAQQAMPHGGKIIVQSKNVTLDDDFVKLHDVAPGSYVKVSVTDTGTGMDHETLRRIFEPFFTTKETAQGTGLGLASAYGIVKNHGGIITVDSEIGKGTTFDIYLPATDEEIVEIKEPPKAEEPKGTGTILIVDDDEDIAEVCQQFLEYLGYRILVANEGHEALEVYEKNNDKVDLVILDMILPDMDGGDVFDKLKELNPNVKVLLSSGYSIDGQATEIMERGCDGFIQKPFDLDMLSEQVHAVLDQ